MQDEDGKPWHDLQTAMETPEANTERAELPAPRTVQRTAHLGELESDDRQEPAVGCQATRPQRADDAGCLCGVDGRSEGYQTADGSEPAATAVGAGHRRSLGDLPGFATRAGQELSKCLKNAEKNWRREGFKLYVIHVGVVSDLEREIGGRADVGGRAWTSADVGIWGFEPEGVIQRISNLLITRRFESPRTSRHPRICHQICHRGERPSAVHARHRTAWAMPNAAS